ncbi:hypothetical protein A2Y99_03395 [Candidatus Gottesmanbacteria bacterium RBG_13_37_7]|uniref:Uncharacterized protein n=1 Tax=Candidatus Gottesmanbacteria bacterium RBG_13_37_7 TaxID=1798369 RepID=A0A1F5YJ51_9BACT|nr:MAG: hypothetical protein A2Y99_03395 [Candidatus Gottesmanbacteria bacterium RBG_13_37_7]
MLKNIIAPVQAWLLSQGRCVGCGNSLTKGVKKKNSNLEEQITCKNCGRIYIYYQDTKKFRRASQTEVK